MVTLNMESRKLMGRMYPENCFKNAKARGSERVNSSIGRTVHQYHRGHAFESHSGLNVFFSHINFTAV